MTDSIEVSAQHLGLPDESRMSSDDGLHVNHEYVDARGWDLAGFERLAAEEDVILAWAANGGDLSSNAAYEMFEAQEAWCTSIDVGLIGTVIALSVVGCCPVTSCVGSAGHHEEHPLVMFWCPQDIWPLVVEAASAAGISLSGCETPGVMAYTNDDWRPLRTFGQRLIALWVKAQH